MGRYRTSAVARSRSDPISPALCSSPAGLVDLIAILPFSLSLVVAADLKVFLVLRLLRFFKLTRYSPAMSSLLEALNAERRPLLGCFVILFSATLMAAALMHLAEAKRIRRGSVPYPMQCGGQS
jgi:voltage-gated potassium channel